MGTPNTEANRRTLLDLTQGGYGYIKIERYNIDFGEAGPAEPDADYNGPINVPTAEMAKFDEAVRKWQGSQGERTGSDYYVMHYGHRTHQEAVEDARRDFAGSPCLVRHADGLYYMHNADKPGRPCIVDVLIDELTQ